MMISESLKSREIIFLKDKNKELKEEIMKENKYNSDIAIDMELEIMKTLLKFKKNKKVEGKRN